MLRSSDFFSSIVSPKDILGAVLDKLPDLVFVFDVPTQKLIFCNPSLQKELLKSNLTRDNMNCPSIRSLIHPDDWQKAVDAMYKATHDSTVEAVEIELRCKNELKVYQYYQIKLSVFEKNGDETLQV